MLINKNIIFENFGKKKLVVMIVVMLVMLVYISINWYCNNN